MREMLRGIERGWVEANITSITRKAKLNQVVATLVRGDRQAVMSIPATVGLSVEAVAERLVQARIKANAMTDLVEALAGMVGPLRAMEAAVADVVIELRQVPPSRAVRAGDTAVAGWLAGCCCKIVADWTLTPKISFGPARRRKGPACLDLEKIGGLVASEGVRAALAVGWLGALGVTYQAIRGDVRAVHNGGTGART
ncbi:MAG: hypothetical protein E2591_27120 [Achromobacter sp.]|uniref:hypothetical protein n=1 Tax=Achromobacter sp. TaxID=134375 RepID=UPI0012C72B4A|nr:hypothetical protein [Achromobacter sp.]MPS81748.1 hypothetical protein [Achromobacter sp.]